MLRANAFTLSLAYAALATTAAPTLLADYIPGRTRVSAEAEMQVIQSSGEFEKAVKVELTELSADGKGVIEYQLKIDGVIRTFLVQRANPGKCGDLYEATENANTRLVMRDLSFAECNDSPAKYTWEAEITDSEGNSRLFVGGEPEHLVLSQ